MEKKRINSVKTKIQDIVEGKYVPQEGFNPNYVLTSYGKRLSRVRIAATVVDKFVSESGKFASVTLDDGTGTVRVKVFNAVAMLEKIDAGSDVDVVGRVKEYQGEIYINPEIISALEDPNFLLLRELEIISDKVELNRKKEIILENKSQASDVTELQRIMKERYGIEPEEVEAILQTEDVPEAPSKDKESILKMIEELDQGEGCDYTELLKAAGLDESTVDTIVNELLSEGSCFEPRPGKIKKL